MAAGIDSLGATEIQQALGESLSAELPATLLFDHPSIDGIVLALASSNTTVTVSEYDLKGAHRSLSRRLMSNTSDDFKVCHDYSFGCVQLPCNAYECRTARVTALSFEVAGGVTGVLSMLQLVARSQTTPTAVPLL